MEMALSNSRRLVRKRYLFEYRGVRFCLIQDKPRQHADHLLTILENDSEVERDHAFAAAAEFASALSWQNSAAVAISVAGGQTPLPVLSLARMKPTSHDFPRIRFEGLVMGYDLGSLPYIENDTQRTALTLFREARASNNDYLSFLFFWQVLEVQGQKAINVVNCAMQKHRSEFHLPGDFMANLPIKGRPLGNYLEDDCRHAIAHIHRKPGKTKLNLDVRADRIRIARSAQVVQIIAEWYIRNVLGLKKRCFLLRNGKRGFPVYVAEDQLSLGVYYEAYAPRPWKPLRRLRRQAIR